MKILIAAIGKAKSSSPQQQLYLDYIKRLPWKVECKEFEVKIPDGLKVSGVILSDHVKNLDWKARRAKFCCPIPSSVLLDVQAKLQTLLAN